LRRGITIVEVGVGLLLLGVLCVAFVGCVSIYDRLWYTPPMTQTDAQCWTLEKRLGCLEARVKRLEQVTVQTPLYPYVLDWQVERGN